jgi:hypothetical protein
MGKSTKNLRMVASIFYPSIGCFTRKGSRSDSPNIAFSPDISLQDALIFPNRTGLEPSFLAGPWELFVLGYQWRIRAKKVNFWLLHPP